MTNFNLRGLRGKWAGVCLTFCGLVAFALGSATEAAAQTRSGCSGTIDRVLVQGNQRIEASTITSYTVSEPGDQFDDEIMDLSLKTLFATGLFSDVTLGCRNQDMLITVVENPIINRVIFENNKALADKELEEEIQLRPRIVYTRSKVQEDVQKILERYRRAGRFAATVEPKIVQLPQNRVDLIYEISEGPVTGVSQIVFKGNKAFDDGELRGVIATKKSTWWNFFEANDNYDPDRMAYDREQLRKFYLSKGYVDFQVTSAIAELPRDRSKFYITFTVSEGEKYKVGEVTVDSSIESVDLDALRQLVPLRDGSTYNADEMDAGVEGITFAAGVMGYAFVEVDTSVRRMPETNTVDVIYRVKEGPRVYIERININGNTRTLDRVIRREFRLVEGDAYNKVLINRSKSRIRGLGYFETVEIEESPGTGPDKSVVDVNVKEQSTGELSVGAGFSSTDSFLADLSISEKNLLGRGQYLRLRLSVSGRRQQADISFTEPYFLGRQMAAGFDIFKLLTDYDDESSYETDSQGVGFRVGTPLTEYSSLRLRYTLRQDDIDVNQAACSLNLISVVVCSQNGQSTTSVLGYTYGVDFRNDPITPTRGWQASFSQDVAGLGGSVKYLGSEASAGIYRGLYKTDVIASFVVNGGYIFGLGDESVRLTDRFFKGGGSFRGFAVSGVGPRDVVTDDAVGAKAYAIGTAELKFPLGLPEEFGIDAAMFSEFGVVGMVDDDDNVMNVEDDMGLRVSAGVSVFWKSPFGPVRLDFAAPLIREDYDQIENFRFSAGTRF